MSVSVGDRLLQLRSEKGLSQKDMSELVDLSLRFYQYVESGEKELSLSKFQVALSNLGLTYEDFFRDEKRPREAKQSMKTAPDLRGAAEILAKIEELPHYRKAFVMALIFRDPNFLTESSPELNQAYQSLSKVR